MAEDNYDIPVAEPAPEDQPVGTVGDFAKAFGAGATDIGAGMAGLTRYFYEQGGGPHGAEISKSLQELFAGTGEDIRGSMNPKSKELLASTLTSDEFLTHPLIGTALKATGMLPSVAALAIPGGLLADAVGATAVVTAGGAALNSGSVIDQFYRKVDEATDDELKAQSPYYEALRESMDEKDARARFSTKMLGMAPAINAIFGAAAGAFGPAGMAARGLAGGAERAVAGAAGRGRLATGALGAAEGAGTNALQEGVADITGQQAEIAGDFQQEFDTARAAHAALEGGALGGLLGGLVGVATGGRQGKAPSTVEKATKALEKADSDTSVTNAASNEPVPQPKTGSTGTPAKPVETAAVGNPQNAPTRGSRDGAKNSKPAKGRAVAENVAPAAPDAAQTAAIAANEAAPQNVAEASQRLETGTAPVAEAAPVTPESNPVAPPEVAAASQRVAEQAPARPVDTGMNVPEQPATLDEQRAQLAEGRRKAVMYPKGTEPPPLPEGMMQTKTVRGVFHYNPKLTSTGEVQRLSKQGRENELLGLGDVSKSEAIDRANAGETPVAVTERTPEGVEVKAAAGTDQTAQRQAAQLEASKTPGNVVAVESPEGVVAKRTGRVLPRLDVPQLPPVDLNAVARANLKSAEPKEPAGKHYSAKEKAAKEANLAKAKDITERHAPSDAEENYMRDPEVRDRIIERAKAMVAAAEEQGVKIQRQIKKSLKGDAASDDASMQVLIAAKALTKVAAKRKTGRQITEATGRFKEDERLIRGGHSDEVIARRREEGDAARARKPTTDDVQASNDLTPESELAKKEGAEVVSTEEAVTPTSNPDAEKDGVKTSAPKSAKGDVRGVDDGTENVGGEVRARAASEVRKVSASDAEKAAILERMNKLMARPDRGADPMLAAARETDTNPSEAQKLAGNYKKGHLKVDGMDVTLENPRGSVRRGVGPDGRAWEVTMPEHYGYIRRTTGADGDHVDAYVGRSGKRHFVVDQLDERTGVFDEHKVMLNFKDEAAAIEAYKKAFSDGRGGERLGNIHEVSALELKTWLKEGDTREPITNHVYTDPDGDTVADILRAPNGERVKALRSEYLSEELKRMDFSKLQGVGGTLARFFKSRIQKLADDSDTLVHFVTPEDMVKLFPDTSKGVPYGYHNIDAKGVSQIVLRNDLTDNGIEHGSLAHVMLHEAVHSVTVREIMNSPAAGQAIRRLMRTAADWMEHPDNAPHVELLYGAETRYAFTNEREFIAEAFSNKAFQEVLTQIPINDPVMSEYLGLNRRTMSMWDVFRGMVKKAVEKITGKMPNFDSVLDAIMKVGEHLEVVHRDEYVVPNRARRRAATAHDMVQGEAFSLTKDAQAGVKRLMEDRNLNTMENAPKLLKLRTFDNLAQIARHYFGENNPVDKIHEAIEAMRVKGEELFNQSAPIVRKLVALRSAKPEVFGEFSNLLHDATVANVHPDVALTDAKNAHLGKNALKGVWSKAQHAELQRRWNALPEEFKTAWHEATGYFRDQQNKMTLDIINNQILKLMGIRDEALGQRIHEGSLTDADRDTLGEMLPTIEKASELAKIEGPYVPLMRRGGFVVKGTYRLPTPTGAKKISANEFEFNTRKEAEEYARKSELQTSIRSVWVDEKTGELHRVTPEGKEERVSKQDLDSENKFRVLVQNEHVEFHPTHKSAARRASELAKSGDLEVHKVVPRQVEPNARRATEMSTALSNLVKKLEHSNSYKDATPMQKAALRRALEEASISSHGSTRIQSKSLPRRGVKGYSEDLVQNTADYAFASSRYLARLEQAPQLEAALKDMNERIKQDYSKDGQFGRQAIANEVRTRIEGDNGFEQGGKFSSAVKRAMSVSFIDKLASPAYSVINAMQPAMVTMPWLAGRHGVGRSFVAMSKAYSDISAAKVIGQAGRETLRRLKGDTSPDDFISQIKKRLANDEERAMIDEHVRVGTVDPSAGMEIRELTRDTSGIGGKADAVLGYLEGVTREMPRAVEAINRTVTALAAYRLERSRGASHEQALQFSKDAVNSTQFNYSATNAPKVFNHPVLKMALQFKKYGQGMYQLIGMQVGRAMRNASPGDRTEALKVLGGIAATHAAMAGALGLPTEPFKYLVMGANAVGLTSMGWGDVENKFREKAANVFGKTGGEIVSRGLPRLLNLDLARMGLDSVTSFGEPRSNKEADVKKWLFDSLAGPVASLGGDWVKGVNQIANGDYERAAESLIPIKAASDSLRAYRQATESKKSAGGREVMSTYTPTEAALRALGFGNAREAEIGAKRSAFYSSSNAQKEARSSLVTAWATAKPQDKGSAWRKIVAWNKDQPKDVRITMKELSDKLKRDAKSATKQRFGISTNKRDKHFLAEGEIYNTR